MAENRFDLELGLDFSKVTEALQQIKSQFTGTSAEFQKIANKFKDSFNTMTNAIKLYGMESSQANTATKSMERAMVELTKNGIDPASIGFQQLSSQIGPLASKMKGAGDSVKKSNMQYTNLALVLQDLPYGFRGIQNNLPALIGGMAGVTGGVYLAASALIAFFTAWDNGMIKFGNSVKLATDYSKEAATAYANETIKLESLYRVATDSNRSMADRLEAAKELKREYPALLGVYSEEEIALGKAKTAYKELTTTIWEYAQAQAATKALEEIASKKVNLMIQKTKLLAKERKLAAIEDAQGVQQGINVYSQYGSQLANVRQEIKDNTQEQKNLVKAASDYLPIIDATVTAETKLNQFKDDGKKGGKQKDTYVLDSLKAKQQAYKDDIYAFRAYGILIINEEERLAVARAKTDGTYEQNKKDIHARYQADRITNDNLFENNLNTILETNAKKRTAIEEKEFKRNQDSIEANMNFETKIYRDSNRIWDQIQKEKLDAQIKYTRDYINKLNEQLRVELKVHKNNVLLQQEDVKNKIALLKFMQFFAFGNVAATELINSAIMKLTGTLAGFGDVSQRISTILFDSLQAALVGIGESIGQLVATGTFDFSILGNVLADALISIGKALIMYSSLVQAAKKALENGQFKAGLVIGVLAVAAGVALKASLNKKRDSGVKEFANGGVISGPTMGLMGEYPGAKSNPEVVAPLDKLKNLIGGGGGGTLEARISGNDLLILMNKAQRNNNTTF
jgi:hypothetical protein